MFTTSVSSLKLSTVRLVFLYNMESIWIIIRKDIWKIRRGGKITNRIFRGNIYCILENIWGITGYFMKVGSIINGNGR